MESPSASITGLEGSERISALSRSAVPDFSDGLSSPLRLSYSVEVPETDESRSILEDLCEIYLLDDPDFCPEKQKNLFESLRQTLRFSVQSRNGHSGAVRLSFWRRPGETGYSPRAFRVELVKSGRLDLFTEVPPFEASQVGSEAVLESGEDEVLVAVFLDEHSVRLENRTAAEAAGLPSANGFRLREGAGSLAEICRNWEFVVVTWPDANSVRLILDHPEE